MLGALTAAMVGITGYVYVGYPVVVEVLSRLRDREGPFPDITPDVSVVVSAFNEREVIAAKIGNILGMDYPSDRMELLVVTDGSNDGTDAVAREAGGSRVRVVHQPERRGKASAMQRGVAHARGDVIVFMDANNICPPDALKRVLEPLADPAVGAVTGAKAVDGGSAEVFTGERLYWRYESAIKRAESRLGCCTTAIGELLAIRRELVPEFPAGLVNDDFFLGMHVARLGWKFAYAPEAVSMEPAAPSAAADAVRRRRMTAGLWQSLFWWRSTLPIQRPVVLWCVGSHKFLRLVLPFAMAGAFLANVGDVASGIGRPRQYPTRALLAGQLAFYALAALGARNWEPRPVRAGASACRYLVRSNVATVEGLVHFIRRRDALHLWQRIDRAP